MILALGAPLAMGSPVTISTSGTWGTLTGSDAFFASNEVWTVSFQVDNPPPLVFYLPNFFYQTSYTNGIYTLNGNPVALTGNLAYIDANGSFGLCLDNCTNVIGSASGAPTLYTGSLANPTLVVGVTQDPLGFAANVNSTQTGTSTGNSTVTVAGQGASAPEPSAVYLLGTGIAGLILLNRRRTSS